MSSQGPGARSARRRAVGGRVAERIAEVLAQGAFALIESDHDIADHRLAGVSLEAD